MMNFSNLPMLALLATPIVRADFYSYALMDKPPMKATKRRRSPDTSPSCNDFWKSIPMANPRNDASSGGHACDGCNEAQDYGDWNIQRFEFCDGPNQTPVTNQQLGHIHKLPFALLLSSTK